MFTLLPPLQCLIKENQLFPAYKPVIMEPCSQQLFIFSLLHPHPAVFCFSLLTVSLYFSFTHPPHFLLYLHLYFTPSLSCCLSVMWSRTDAGSPNCGTAISALLWLLGSLSETGLGDAPPSPSASKKKKKKREREGESGRAGHQAISQNSDDPSKYLCFQNGLLHICSAAEHIGSLEGFRGVWICSKSTSANPQDSVADLHCDAAHLLMRLWWKMLCADFLSSRLEWNLPCVANTVGCWRAAQVWDIGRGVRLLGRSCMICYSRATMSHGSGCSMWLWRTIALPKAQWQYLEASYDVLTVRS